VEHSLPEVAIVEVTEAEEEDSHHIRGLQTRGR